MRVLSVLTYYAPHWTGLTAHARQLAEGLAARGHAVTVLAYRHTPALAAREVIGGVTVERVRPLARASRGMLAPAFVSTAARLARAHDVVLLNTPMLEAGPIALAARRAGRPTVVVHHGDLLMPAGLGNRLVERGTTASMAGAARLAARVTTYSDDYGAHSDFLLPFRPKLTAISPPVSIPAPRPQAAAAWRARLGLADRRLIGFAGRFVEEKGADVLLRALPAVLAGEPRAHLCYAGDPHPVYERFYEHCAPLLAPVAAHVSEVGLLTDRQALADFYAACDVLALPSRSDCFALVQAEAMLCGTPVVASDIPGAREAVRRTGMGRLVAPLDPAALAAGLLAVLRAPDAYRRPRAAIAAAFDPVACIDAYESLLREVTAAGRGVKAVSSGGGDRPSGERLRSPVLPPPEAAQLDEWLADEPDPSFRRRMRWLLAALDLRDGDRVLAAGCGSGFELLLMRALRRLTLVGVDADAAALARAARRGSDAALARARLEALPLADATVDRVLLAEVLEHVEDDGAVLRELHRVLRSGGRLAIAVPHADYPLAWDPLNRAWTALGGRPIRRGPLVGIWTNHRRLYWPQDLAQRVTAAGFAVDALDTATHHALPFAHLLLYGVGAWALRHGLLPPSRRGAVDAPARAAHGAPLTAAARRLLDAADRRNESPAAAAAGTFVNVLLVAHKRG